MKKTFATLAAALMMLGLFGVASAQADPGPNENNQKGLCTAFYNGQKKGHDKQAERNGSYPGPFQPLVDGAGDDEGPADGESAEADAIGDLWEWCSEFGIMGNPEHGRFSCSEVPDSEGDYTCERNPAPNEGKGKPAA